MVNFDRARRSVRERAPAKTDVLRIEASVTWGQIGGSLADQMDLISVLNAKLEVGPYASLDQGEKADTALQTGAQIPWTDVTGKPTFFSGLYADLSGKPTLFDGAYSSLSGIPSTFTPSAHNHAYGDLTGLPTLFSGAYADLTDKPTLGTASASDAGDFAAAGHTHAGYQVTLVSGTNIKTINGESLLGSGDLVIAGSGGGADFADLTGAARDNGDLGAELSALDGYISDLDTARDDHETRLTDIEAPKGRIAMPMLPAAGVYVTQAAVGGALGTVAQAANRVTIAPYSPDFDITIDQVTVSVSTLIASSLAKVVIYGADASGRPTTVLAESADMDCSSVGTKTAALSLTMMHGQTYWVGVRSSANQTLRSLTAAALPVLSYTAASTPVIQTVLTETETYGDPAADWTYSSSQHSNITMPIVLMRIA